MQATALYCIEDQHSWYTLSLRGKGIDNRVRIVSIRTPNVGPEGCDAWCQVVAGNNICGAPETLESILIDD